MAMGLLLALAGLFFVAWGIWTGAIGGVVLGAGLLVGWLLDGLVLLVGDPWRGHQVTRQVVPHPSRAGQPVRVWLLNGSDGRRSARWLTTGYQDRVPWGQGWLPVADVTEGYGRYGVTPPRRGSVEFGPLRLLAHSPLGLWQSGRTSRQPTSLRVWPATVPMVVPPPVATEARASTGLGLPRPHLDDTTLREYQPGDDLHRVHWRSLARSNRLLTRAEEPSSTQNTVAALRVQPGATSAAIDLGVELLASWAEAMRKAGNSFEVQLGAETMPQPGNARLMDMLANIGADDLATVTGDASVIVEVAGDGLVSPVRIDSSVGLADAAVAFQDALGVPR